MKLAPDVIFYCNMIVIAREKASNKREIISFVNKELKKWKIPTSRALECIDEYVGHLGEIMKEHDSFTENNPSDAIYQRYRVEKSILLEVRSLLSPK